MTLVPRIVDLLKANQMDDVLVFAGGIIPDEDVPALMEAGVSGVFGPGANTDEIAEFIRKSVNDRRGNG